MTCQRFHTVSRMRENCTCGSMRGLTHPARRLHPLITAPSDCIVRTESFENTKEIVPIISISRA